jgi:hypothetical protein
MKRLIRRRRNSWVRSAGNRPRKGERKNIGVGFRNAERDKKWIANI